MKTKVPDAVLAVEVNHRGLVKTTAIGGLAVAGSALTLPSSRVAHTIGSAIPIKSDEKVVWSVCIVNCGSRCPPRMHVADGEIKYVETDNTGDDNYDSLHQVRVCLRGCSTRRRVYNPDRLKCLMKRVRARGEGKFERTGWEGAYDTITTNMQHLIKEYDDESIYPNYDIGTLDDTVARSRPPGNIPIAHLMNCCGGYLNHYGDYSSAQIAEGLNYIYGGWADGSSPSDIENSKLVVLSGSNPGETRMSGGGVTYCLEQARQKSSARTVTIDPCYTDTGAGREDEWTPICLGADAALVSDLAYITTTENLVDQIFPDKYRVGHDEETPPASTPENGHYKACILGEGPDGVIKAPEWTSQITGVPADKIIKLACGTGSTEPAFISQGWGPQRHADGEIVTRVVPMLVILTGNVGINESNSDARGGSYSLPLVRMSTLRNPVQASISTFMWTDAIERDPEMMTLCDGIRGKDKLDVPIKMIWNYVGNCLINQRSEINRTHEILQDDEKCELIVAIDRHTTSSAKYADILLPDYTVSEQMDFAPDASCGNTSYVIFNDQVIKPYFECKTIHKMTNELAKHLGVGQQFTGDRTQGEWMRHLCTQPREAIPELSTFEESRKQGIFKKRDPQRYHVVYKAFREDPQANPPAMPSDKIEIYPQVLADTAATWELSEGDVIDPLPTYTLGSESYQDPLNKQYPLQLMGFHYKSRVYSTCGNVDVSKATYRQGMWINPLDAQKRGIDNDDRVRIFNNRGEVRIEAKVMPRMMLGTVALGEGA